MKAYIIKGDKIIAGKVVEDDFEAIVFKPSKSFSKKDKEKLVKILKESLSYLPPESTELTGSDIVIFAEPEVLGVSESGVSLARALELEDKISLDFLPYYPKKAIIEKIVKKLEVK